MHCTLCKMTTDATFQPDFSGNFLFVNKYFQPFLSSSVRDLEAGGELGEGIVSVALLGVTRDKGKGCLPGQLGLRHETNH